MNYTGAHATLDTRHRTKKSKTENTRQKTIKVSNKDPIKTGGESRCPRMVSSSCLLEETNRVTHVVKFGKSLVSDRGKK